MDRWKFCSQFVGFVFAIGLMVGCQPAATNTQSDTGATSLEVTGSDGVSAEQILTLMKAVYSTAKTYRDEGVLVLSYRKDGLLTEEPQRWSTSWSADGKLYAEIFGAQLTGDGRRLGCFVYDIDTANLDGQRMVAPYADGRLPLDEVFRDPIAKVFLGGYSELPLNETDPLLRNKLVPAPLNLLTNQLSCPWLHASVDLLERQPDDRLEEKECYVIRSMAVGMGCDLWIDKSTGLLVQMSLPLKLLDPQVMAAPSITDLRLLAKFSHAAIDVHIDPETFELKRRKNSTPVKSFVPLPEALPVESIGQVVDTFRLIQPNGNSVDHLYFDGKPTALLWLGGENSYPTIGELNNLAKQLPAGQYNFGIVYSDTDLAERANKPHLMRPELTAASASSDIPMFYDPGLTASTELAIRDIPSVVLLDEDSRVQYASEAISLSWLKKLASAMERVALGDELADEILAHYQSFMTKYQTALLQQDASKELPAGLAEQRSSAAKVAGPSRGQVPKRRRAGVIVSRLAWSNDQLDQPGNMVATAANDPTILVIDGARSIVRLNVRGEIVSRTALDLPDGVGVSRIRITSDGSTRAVFSPLGRQAFFFDAQWKLIDAVPKSEVEFAGPITDVNFQSLPDDGAGAQIASKTSGLFYVIPGEKRPQRIIAHRLNPDSIASGPGTRAAEQMIVADGALWTSTGTLNQPMELVKQRYRFKTIKRVMSGDRRFYVASGYDDTGWKLLAFPPKSGKPIWKQAIGSQFFESLIDSVAIVDWATAPQVQAKSNMVVIAIACHENTIHLLGSDGGWLGDVNVKGSPQGVCLVRDNAAVYLLVSTGDRVECWSLE